MWAWKAFKDFVVSFLAFPLAPFIVLFTNKEGESPSWAFPWLTYDNIIDGDAGHLQRWPDDGTKLQTYLRRVAWLWRNRGYNYSYYQVGAEPAGTIRYKGTPLFWKRENPKGWCYAKCDNAWMLFAWWPYPLFGIKRGIRVYLGWKLREKCEHPERNIRVMLVTHINPFKGKM